MASDDAAASGNKESVEIKQHIMANQSTPLSSDNDAIHEEEKEADPTQVRVNGEVATPAPASDLAATNLPGSVPEEADTATQIPVMQGEAEAGATTMDEGFIFRRQRLIYDLGDASREENELPAVEEGDANIFSCAEAISDMPSPAEATEGDEEARTAHKNRPAVSPIIGSIFDGSFTDMFFCCCAGKEKLISARADIRVC